MPDEVQGTSIAAQITADLEASGQAAPAPEAPAEAEPAAVETPAVPAETTASLAEGAAPEPLKLTDSTVVLDTDGNPRPWGEIKAERMRQADYTRKTQQLAELRREALAVKAEAEAQAQAAKLAAELAKLPALPEDDPYAQHNAANREAIRALTEQQAKFQQQMQAEALERMEMAKQAQLEASQIALEAKRRQLRSEFKLDDDDLEFVERRYLSLRSQDKPASLEEIAKAQRAKIDRLEQEAIKKFKEQHRVGSDAGGASSPGSGADAPALTPSSPGFAEKFADELRAAFSRR